MTEKSIGEKMAEIWKDAEKDIAFREQTTDHFRFQSSYHGNGRFMFSAITSGASGTQVSLHLTRDDLMALADVAATALGGCYYHAPDDADSEL